MEKTNLGYACINMTLRKSDNITINRTCIKRTLETKGLPHISNITLQNVTDLSKIIQWNYENGISVYRMSSAIIPWFSEFEIDELPDAKLIRQRLKEAGDLAKKYNQRLTFHPGQFCVLASPSEKVVDASIVELNNHAEVMDVMGLPQTPYNKINIHIGGAYGDKKSAMERFCKNFKRLSPGAQARLTVENDDKASMYSVVDLYHGIYKVIGIPIVFDYYHHKFCTGDLTEKDALILAASTWPEDIKQIVHYSESRRQEKSLIVENLMSKNNITLENISEFPTVEKLHQERQKIKVQAHSDYIVDFIDSYGLDIDVMVESKAKELSVLGYREYYQKTLKKVS